LLSRALVSFAIAPELAEPGKLCPQKDVIVEKFRQLLAKLEAQGRARNATDQAAFGKQNDMQQAWLDAQSACDSAEQRRKDAIAAKEYALKDFDEFSAALQSTVRRRDREAKEFQVEKDSINAEMLVIRELIRLIEEFESDNLGSSSREAVLQQFNQKVVPPATA
jgi:hypothetical protein